MLTVMVCPDLHIPFHHQDAFNFLIAVKKRYKPDICVNLGDMEDWHSISMHDHDPDGFSAGAELAILRKKIQPLFKIFPELYICNSNHGSLPLRRAFKFGLPRDVIKGTREILQAPSAWKWADQWEFDGVIYEHGDPFTGASAAIKAAEQNMQSTVIGHVHSFAGIQYSANSKHLIFGFNVGCLIERTAYAFEYAKKIKKKPILGCGIIRGGIPTFIPMTMNTKHRWIGKLVG